MANTDWPDLKFIVDWLITNSTDSKQKSKFAFCSTIFCIFAKRFGNFHNQRRVVIYDLKSMAEYQE